MTSPLPTGWTIEQIRTLWHDRSAAALSLDRFVVVEDSSDPSGYTAIQPEVILGFHDLCLVLDDDEWWMGQLDSDGSVACWASYDPGLAEAVRGL